MKQSILEASVLGGLLIDPEGFERVGGEMVESDFTTQDGREIFAAIRKAAENGSGYDAITIAEDHPNLEQGVLRLARDTPSAANLEQYALRLREKTVVQRIKDSLDLALREPFDSLTQAQTVLGRMYSELDKAISRGMGSDKSFSEVLPIAIESIERANLAKSSNSMAGVPSGIGLLDKWTGGFHSPQLIVLAARPSVGKTALANQIALHAAMQGHGVGICSLEMGDDELIIRLLANHYGLNGTALSFGEDGEIQKMGERMSASPLPDLPLWFDSETFGLGAITARLGHWKRKHNIRLGIVDHIGLVEAEGRSANERLGLITRTLKKTAKQLDIPIIAVSQLSRAVERDKRRPALADLRDSGSIEQDADTVIFLHAEADQEGKREVEMKLGLLKNRRGRKSWLGPFIFDGATQTFSTGKSP